MKNPKFYVESEVHNFQALFCTWPLQPNWGIKLAHYYMTPSITSI